MHSILIPIPPHITSVGIEERIPHQSEGSHVAQHSVGQSLQFVQAQQRKFVVILIPAAFRILDHVPAEVAGLDEVSRLLFQLGRDRQLHAVEALERLEVVHPFQADQLETAFSGSVHIIEETQVIHFRNAVQPEGLRVESPQIRHRKSACNSQFLQVHPFQGIPVRQARAVIDLQSAARSETGPAAGLAA